MYSGVGGFWGSWGAPMAPKRRRPYYQEKWHRPAAGMGEYFQAAAGMGEYFAASGLGADASATVPAVVADDSSKSQLFMGLGVGVAVGFGLGYLFK